MSSTVTHANILFARAGSKGVPNKNKYLFLGKFPSFEIPLVSAIESRSPTYICTDDFIIEKSSVARGAIPIERPAHLATDDSLLQDAIHYCYQMVLKDFDVVTILLANAPYVNTQLILQSLEILKNNPTLDSVVTTTKLPMFAPERAKRNVNNMLVPYSPELPNVSCSRNSHSGAYFPNGGLTTVRSTCLADMSKNTPPLLWMGRNIGFIEQGSGLGDIDEPWQISVVEAWLKQNLDDQNVKN